MALGKSILTRNNRYIKLRQFSDIVGLAWWWSMRPTVTVINDDGFKPYLKYKPIYVV